MPKIELIGEVAVDSGQLMVTDPSYIDAEWKREPFAIVGDIERDEGALFNHSYDGACRSTLRGGHGELAFEKGPAGAGVAFSTAWGDGRYLYTRRSTTGVSCGCTSRNEGAPHGRSFETPGGGDRHSSEDAPVRAGGGERPSPAVPPAIMRERAR